MSREYNLYLRDQPSRLSGELTDTPGEWTTKSSWHIVSDQENIGMSSTTIHYNLFPRVISKYRLSFAGQHI
jgi:hypothetical protein